MESPLTLSLLEDDCVLTEVSRNDLLAPHRDRGRPFTRCTCLVEASLVTLCCSSLLAYIFHLNISNVTTKTKIKLIFILDAKHTHTKPMLVKKREVFNLRSIHFCKNCLVRLGTIFVNKMLEVIFLWRLVSILVFPCLL